MAVQHNQISSNNNVVIENQDGTVSVYTALQFGSHPVILTKASCEALKHTYVFDINTQQCRWSPAPCSLNEAIKLVLNPNGNDGSLFYVNANDNCSLSIDFDYLFKIKCETLFNILVSASTQSPINIQIQQQIANLELQISQQTVLCENISNQINSLNTQINNTAYSVICVNTALLSGKNIIPSNSVFPKSGFGLTPAPFSYGYFASSLGITYCLTEPDGLQEWANILGSTRYQKFLNGDALSYSCADVQQIVGLNDVIFNNNLTSSSQQPILLFRCHTPFGTKTNLINQLNVLTQNQTNCQTQLNTLIASLSALNTSLNTTTLISCSKPVEVLEMLDVSVTLDVILPNNTLQTVYEYPLFPEIGLDNLYSYLITHPDSGFYICGGPAPCTPMSLVPFIGRPVGGSCASIVNNMLYDLFIESNLSGTTNAQTVFTNSLPINALASKWLHFHTIITNPTILNQIANKKIKLSFKIKHTCSDLCVLVDEIVLDKLCTEVSESNIFLTQSPGFELDRIRDNKKSWLNNTTPVNRQFLISNNVGGNNIRETNYDVNDERLIINSKEIDLDISLASAIETDVWCYIADNPCLLTGETSISCSAHCYDDSIDFNSLMIQPLSGVTTIEDFEYIISSELIDAKDRQTLSGYPTLRALYDRYMNSSAYCSTVSSAFDYTTMDQFANLVGNYWVDIVEQVIPATTIWGSVKIYSNTIFDQQKFKYRAYSSLFCGNPFSGQTVLNPINGTSGTCASGVTVISRSISTSPNIRVMNTTTTCNTLCIAQMNAGSEFIGSVTIIGKHKKPSPISPNNLYAI